MICATVAEKTVAECVRAIEGLSFAEIRLDAMDVTPRDMGLIFSRGKRLIATCRPGKFNDDERRELLITSIDEGASFVDLEVDSDEEYGARIVERARTKGCKVIVSFHDYEKTPEREELLHIVARCFEKGADVAKIACRVESGREIARLVGLLDSPDPPVVIGMGHEGAVTRVMAPLLGSPFTYGARESGKEVVEGQLDCHTLRRVFNFLREETNGQAAVPEKKGGSKE